MRLSAVLLALWATGFAGGSLAQSKAFVSVSSSVDGRAIRIVDLQTMTVEASITGIGDEPGRMVANADRSRVYVSSWSSISGGQVYAIDTATRTASGPAPAGNAQNRAIAISPDGLRVYTFKREVVSTNETIGVLVLDALTLAEIATVPITGPGCTTNFRDLVVMPDGRIVAGICNDGLRISDPVTFAVAVRGGAPAALGRLLGVSPDGSEIYIGTGSNAINVFGITGLRTFNVDTGVSTDLTWNVPVAPSYPGFTTSAAPVRLTVVPVVGGLPGDAIYLFSYFSAGAPNEPIAWARASTLSSGLRQLTRLAAVGSTAVIGVGEDGLLGLSARGNNVRRIAIDPGATDASLITSQGAFLSLPGVGTLTDIVVVKPLFADGFEGDAAAVPSAPGAATR
ncbi:MAG: YncE family protein [Pseudomonadota bacterium]